MSDYIPEETVVQIMMSLPVKSLLRFRTVCKEWKQLIDSTTFYHEHLAVQKPRFLIRYKSRLDSFAVTVDPHGVPSADMLRFPVEFGDPFGTDVDEYERLLLVGTHRGVVCFLNSITHDFILWNPAIRKFSSLPLGESLDSKWNPWEYAVFFNGCFGFWIDPSTMEFKIILLLQILSEYSTGFGRGLGLIYSSSRPYWRAIPPEKFNNLVSSFNPPVMIQSVAYWRSCTNVSFDILSFDFVLERFDFMDTPHDRAPGDLFWQQPWQGSLAVLFYNEAVVPCSIYMYVRQEGSWVKMFHYDLIPNIINLYWVLPSESEKESYRCLFDVYEEGQSLVLYDIKSGNLPLMYPLPKLPSPIFHFYVAYDFVESFLLP